MKLTVFLAINADGINKLKPYVILTSEKPRCFTNVDFADKICSKEEIIDDFFIV